MFNYLDFFHSLNTFGIRPGLSRIQELMNQLKNPESQLQFIHVAGTNGKGSVCTFISQILQSAGYKTGLFLSPYVVDFRERIQINSEMIDEEALTKAAKQVQDAITTLNEKGIIITEFEAVTAAALLCFYEQGCQLVVLETGLGGRFDATNIIQNPLLSIITSISLDHTKVLGSSLSEIAFEKCGIIKEGCPVITSENQAVQALKTIEKIASERCSQLIIAKKDEIKPKSSSIFGNEFSYKSKTYKIQLAGKHQLENALLAIKAAETLNNKGLKIQYLHIQKGLESSQIPARIQILSKDPLIILDGSHNEGSTKALAEVINNNLSDRKLLGLMGMMEDKDYEKSIGNLAPLFSKIITTTPKNPRAVNAKILEKTAQIYCQKIRAIASPLEALEQAMLILKDYDALIICGSLYLAGEILNNIRED